MRHPALRVCAIQHTGAVIDKALIAVAPDWWGFLGQQARVNTMIFIPSCAYFTVATVIFFCYLTVWAGSCWLGLRENPSIVLL